MKKETLKREFIIGGSEDLHNIFTMELNIRNWNGYPEFTASFNEGELINIDERNEDARGYYEDMFDCADNESKLYYLQDGDRTKEDWIDACIDEEYDYRDRIDCSCTDYEFTKDGETYNFETIGGGQHDPRKCEYFISVNNTVDKLLEFWDKHHLKEISDEEKSELLKLCKKMEKYENIEEYIEENIEI